MSWEINRNRLGIWHCSVLQEIKTIPYKSISNRSGKENVILLLLLGNSIRMIPIAKITEAKWIQQNCSEIKSDSGL